MFETRDIERNLLKILTTNKVIARPYMNSLDDAWFSGIRQNIFRIVRSLYEVSPTVITDMLFSTELQKTYPDKSQSSQIKRHMTEWSLIQQADAKESVEVLIDKLRERQQSEAVAQICEKTLEFLQQGDITNAMGILRSESVKLNLTGTNDTPVVDLLDYDDVLEKIEDQKKHPEKYRGLQTGFKSIDKRLGGLFGSEMTLFAAVTGIGKSTMLKQLAKGIVLNNYRKNVLHITNEEHREQVRMKYFSLFSDVDFFHFKQATIDDVEIEKFKESMEEAKDDRYGRIFIKELAQFSNCSEIYKEVYELEQKGFPIHAIVIDYLDHLAPMQRAWSENDEQAKAAWDCKGLCIDLNIPVITATQAATTVEQKQERGRHMGKLDVYGSKRRIHAANVFIGITYNDNFDDSQLVENGGERENAKQCDKFWTAECLKSRDGASFIFECRHCVQTGRVLEERWSNREISLEASLKQIEAEINGKVTQIEQAQENSEKTDSEKELDPLVEQTETKDEQETKTRAPSEMRKNHQKTFEENQPKQESNSDEKSASSIFKRLKSKK